MADYFRSERKPPSRQGALRLVADLLVMAADESTSRDAEERLRDAAARVFDALSFERRASLQ